MKKVIYMKFFENGEMTKSEKVCNDFDDLAKTYDECVDDFCSVCKEYGQFSEEDLYCAEGNALGVTYKVLVVDYI